MENPKKFITPEMAVVTLVENDVIRTSGPFDNVLDRDEEE